MGAEPRPPGNAHTIRTMTADDGADVIEILRQAPEAVAWTGDTLREVLGWQNTVALVSEEGRTSKVTGFLMKRQAADEAEILNLAVGRGSRRRGAGSALLLAAEELLRARGVHRLFLEVRESNVAGLAFYRKHGFCEVGRRGGYYQQPVEAAVVMEKKLTA